MGVRDDREKHHASRKSSHLMLFTMPVLMEMAKVDYIGVEIIN